MGGIGSGRHWHWNAKSTTADYRSIDVRRWAREDMLTPGKRFAWQWSIDGEKVASIEVRAELGHVRLVYRSQTRGSDWESLDYPVRLLSQPCHYGGNREWFACPAQGCGRRVAKLYGGRIFACRQCNQLAYPSQREANFQRGQRRADKLRGRLGWAQDPDLMEGIKPKGMHWQTYHRLVAELEDADQRSTFEWASFISQKFGSLSDL